MRILILVTILATPLHGQIFKFDAGSSTLFGASAAQVTAFFPNNTASVSAGDYAGHFLFGASEEFQFHGWQIDAGDRQISLMAGNEGLFASFVGTSLTRIDKVRKRKISFFIGALGNMYTAPFSFGTQPHHFGSGVAFEQKAGDFKFNSIAVTAGNQKTAIQNVEYKWKTFFIVDAAGGWLQNDPLFNGSAAIQVRGLGADLNRQTIFLNNIRSDLNSESLFYQFHFLDGHVSEVRGVAGTIRTSGSVYGGGVRLWGNFLTFRTDYFSSKRTPSTLNTTAMETVRSKWVLSESLSHGRGQTQFALGGGFHSNRFSADISHQELYYPLLSNPWQQTLAVTVSFRFRNANVNVGTLALPNGGIKWGAYGSDYAYRDQEGPQLQSLGQYEIKVHIEDTAGLGVEGGAVQIGKHIYFSDSDGNILVRVAKNQALPLTVLPEKFLLASWRLVKSPDNIAPGQAIDIIVERK